MSTDDQIAAAAERARDDDTERHHGGDGVEVIERYTDAAWLDCMADLIMPDTEEDAKELRYQIREALYWLDPSRVLLRLECSAQAMDHISKIGRIILSTAIRNGVTLEQLEHE